MPPSKSSRKCILAFRGGCRGHITKGGHCERHLAAEQARAVLKSAPFDPEVDDPDGRYGSIERLAVRNGAHYRKPEFVWDTEVAWEGTEALRRPSQRLRGRRTAV